MLEMIELNVDVKVQTLIWKMKTKPKNLDQLEGACPFWHVPMQVNHLSTEDEYFLSVRGARSKNMKL